MIHCFLLAEVDLLNTTQVATSVERSVSFPTRANSLARLLSVFYGI